MSVYSARHLALVVLSIFLGLAAGGNLARAQNPAGNESVPSPDQHHGLAAFYEGEWRDALKMFDSGLKGAIKGANGRWIDSICYHAMTGECLYQMGQPAKALDQFRLAIQQYLQYSQFMIQVRWTPLARSSRTVTVPWGTPSDRMVFANIPERMQIGIGNVQIVGGGPKPVAIDSRRYIPVDGTEIVRCLVHSVRRYGELRGPLAPDDKLLIDLLGVLVKRPVPAGCWGEAWMDVLTGVTYRALGKGGDAVQMLKRGQIADGQFVHPLTSICLMELGLIAMADGDFKTAGTLFEEASYPAAFYGEIWGGPMVLEETFSYAHIAHELANRKQPYLKPAAVGAWAKPKKYLHLWASVGISAAENQATLGQTVAAVQTLTDVQKLVGREDMMKCRPGARWNHISAVTHYQAGRVLPGDEAIAAALAFQELGGSLWLFHIAQVDAEYTTRGLTARGADVMFERVLRDPLPMDWMIQPLDSLSVVSTPHETPYQHWFEVCLERKEVEKALEVADQVRRHRFFSSMLMGGRLVGLRWLLEAPELQLEPKIALQRRDILQQYPEYQQRMDQVKQVRDALAKMPLVVDDALAKKAQAEQLATLTKLSLDQETLLRQIAVRREPAAMLFPFLVSTKAIQQAMPAGQALWVFFNTPRALYSFLIDKQSYGAWKVANPKEVNARTMKLLKEIGNYDGNRPVPMSDLTSDTWKKASQDLSKEIFKLNTKVTFPPKLQELVIVPDGPLWYLPFEALQIDVGGKTDSLISHARVRYAPTMALAGMDRRPRRQAGNTAVVVGKLFPGAGHDLQTQAAFQQLSQAVPGTVALPSELPASSAVYSTLFDRLIVLDEIPPAAKDRPYDFTPVTTDKGPFAVLNSWMMLPWGGPEQVVLPGFHTPAEAGLKEAGNGNDVFYAICGFMATGTRTVLISRWRTGGKSAFEQVREFTQELDHSTAAEAWQRAVFLSMETALAPEQEPRVVGAANVQMPKTSHPFFWAGNLLIDTGSLPVKEAVKVERPADPAVRRN